MISSGWNPFRYDSMQIQKKKLETINYYYGHYKSISYCKYYSFLIFSYIRKNLFILVGAGTWKVGRYWCQAHHMFYSSCLSIFFWCPLIEFYLSPHGLNRSQFCFLQYFISERFSFKMCHSNNKIIKQQNIQIQLIWCVLPSLLILT